jgi:hypothetical protein
VGIVAGTPARTIAQEERTGSIEGRVLDEARAAVAGATLELTGAGGFARRTITARDGSFLFVGLAAGTYRLMARQIGFTAMTSPPIVLGSGEHLTREIRLETAPVELESVDVIVSPVEIDRSTTEFSTKLDEKTIALLPSVHDPKELVELTAGARAGHVWGGATDQANNYQIDGLAANHPGVGGDLIQPSIAWIESIEVVGLGAGAEHGNFQGGLISITTKSGGDQTRGSFRTSVESHRLNSGNLGGNEIGSELFGRYDIEGEAGGPLVKERLFYFVGGQWLQRGTRHLNHLGLAESRFLPDVEERREGKYFAKLTWMPTGADVIDLSAGGMQAIVERAGQTGYESAEAAWRLAAPTRFYGVSWQRRLGGESLLQVRLASFAREETRLPYGGRSVPSVQVYGLLPPYRTFQNAPLHFRHEPRSSSAAVNWDLHLNTGGIEHLLKIGGDYSLGSFVDERIRSGGMTWRPPRSRSLDPADPSTWTFSSIGFIPSTWGGEVRLHTDVENSALYVQDYIAVGRRFGVNPGLRYGRWRGWITPDGGTGERFLVVGDAAIEPRIGVTLDPTGYNILVFKAHWGRYHQNMLSQLYDRIQGGDVFSNEQLWYYRGEIFDNPRTNFTPEERDRLADGRLFTLENEIILNETGPVFNYQQPYIDQWVIGVERVFSGKVKFGAVYVNRRNRQMVALVDRNRESNYTSFENVRIFDRSGQPVLYNGLPLGLNRIYIPNNNIIGLFAQGCGGQGQPPCPPISREQLATLTWDPDFVLSNVPEARREFDQLQLSLDGSFRTWGMSASVVFTSLQGDLDSVTGYDDPAGFGAGPFVRVNESTNFFGALDNFADRELKASVYGQIAGGFQGGIYWNYATGDHYSPRFTLNGLEYVYEPSAGGELARQLFLPHLTGHTVFVGERGKLRYPPRATVDMRLEREFAIGDARWALGLDAFNIFNDDTVVEHNTSVNRGKNFYDFLGPPPGTFRPSDPNEFYQAVRERLDPRSLRLGVTVRF